MMYLAIRENLRSASVTAKAPIRDYNKGADKTLIIGNGGG